jgi:hypothetical protein
MKNEHGKKSWQVRTKKLFENHNKMCFFFCVQRLPSLDSGREGTIN